VTGGPDLEPLRELITRREGSLPAGLRFERRTLSGGLEAALVDQVTARYRTSTGRARLARIVIKRLDGPAAREAGVYQHVVAAHADQISPELYAVERPAPGHAVLYLEALRPVNLWPWGAPGMAQSVLERVAHLHARVPDKTALTALRAWDYDAALQQSAAVTLERLEQVCRQLRPGGFGGALRWGRRVAGALASLRQELLAFPLLPSSMIHGDLHPGNVVVRRRRATWQPVLLDWGRARIGSPLEDVSCWLQSLGAWEPEARRRHDTLFGAYLNARGVVPQLSSELRAAYWLAGACNALSGALAYHLSALLDERLPSSGRASAAYSARQWVRVLRRAAAFWC
jgi:hypothetical protein